MVAWSLGFPSPDGESAMPKENAVENIWLWWPRFRDAGGIRRELLDQVIGARPAPRRTPQPIEIIGGAGRTRTCNQTVMSIPTSSEKSDKSET